MLLPPSEGKTSPADGDPVNLESLSHPRLTAQRRMIADALARFSGTRNAAQALGAGPSLAGEVLRNVEVWHAPAAPAARVYTGVLYDAANAAAWEGETMDRAADRVLIVSALWGAITPADAIPAYRLPMSASLPRIGTMTAYWKRHLAPALDAEARDRLVIDCRSSTYLTAWAPVTAAAWVTVRVERQLAGKRQVVSHMAKHTRGLLAGALVNTIATPGDPSELADSASSLLGEALLATELRKASGNRHELTLVLSGD